MQRFLKSRNRLTATVRTGNFRHLTQGQSRGTPTIVLAQGAVFKEIEGRWSKRLREQSTAMHERFDKIEVMWISVSKIKEAGMLRLNAKYAKSRDRERTTLLNSFNELRQRHEKKAETLVLHNSDLLDAVSEERNARMKLQRKYNICGALERMVFLAKLQQKVPPTAGVQQGLCKLAQSGEFTAILDKEVEARKLDARDVIAGVSHLYRRASNGTNGNDDIITIRATKFNDNERAALAVFLKIQREAARCIYILRNFPENTLSTYWLTKFGRTLNPSGMHTPSPAIVQTKEITAYALWVDTLSGRSFFGAGRQVTPTPISFDKLRICACDRRRNSRIRVGYAA
ncbi:hypothetical protein B9Z19DRAFT_1130947 [Tuber borchii]|uniref:Uncharacterized protein n=1 Tax=Tuber borchii TaxID=42251 RepID=A0A2T6ZJI8_TUBBO|nr:hypothetical protein B9Z19DRAFT_1130947 [Tuber borchii]